MPATFTVTAHPERDLIHMALSGFFDEIALARFDQARREANARLRPTRGGHDTLVDVRDMKLQAQDVVESFRAMIADPATIARRLAFVTGDAAVRMQVRRVMGRDGIRCFADVAAAERWLATPADGYALAG